MLCKSEILVASVTASFLIFCPVSFFLFCPPLPYLSPPKVVMDTLDQLDAALRRRVTATMNARPSAASAIASGLSNGGGGGASLMKNNKAENSHAISGVQPAATKMDSGGVIGLDLSAMGLTPHEVSV
jgi:hypothetical protein